MLRAFFAILLCSVGVLAQSPARQPHDFTTVAEGAMPVVLSAPHGGRLEIPESWERRGIGVDKFTTVRDTNTSELTELIARELENKLGVRPYLVIARFTRKHADANRPAADAYESDAAKPVYEFYHASLAKARAEVERRWGMGLVIDVHGQGSEPNTIFRGTAHRKSVAHLLDRHGEAALTGPSSLFGYLARKGVTVHPPIGSKDAEARAYSGGYITQTYGSSDGGRIDAIQMEFGTNLRQKARIEETARLTAEAIAAFAAEFLPPIK